MKGKKPAGESIGKKRIVISTTSPEGVIGPLPLLRRVVSVLLAMPVRIQYLYGLHAGQSVGDELQRDYMAMP